MKVRRALAALAVLTLLASAAHGLAQPDVELSVSASAQAAPPGGEVEVRVSLVGLSGTQEEGILQVSLVRAGEVISSASPRLLQIPPGETTSAAVALWVPEDAAPGVYAIRVTLSVGGESLSRELTFHVSPTLAQIAELAMRLTSVDERLDRLTQVRGDDPRVQALSALRESLSIKFGELARLAVEGGDPVKAAKLYEEISSSLDGMEEEIDEVSDLRIFFWSFSRELDLSLSFSPQLSLEFWIKVATASIWVLLIALALFPLYSTSYNTLATLVVRELGLGEEALESVNSRAVEMLKRVQEELRVASSMRGMVMVALAGALASVGMMADNVTAVIGSMLLAPLMSTFVAGAVGLALYDVWSEGRPLGLDLFYRGFRVGIKGTALIVALSALTTFLTRAFVPVRMTEQLALRASPNLADLAIALAAGFAGAVASMQLSDASSLVGSAVAIALVPPAAAVGVGVAMGNPSLAVGALTLTTVNVVAIVSAGYLSAKIYAIYPLIRGLYREAVDSISGAWGEGSPAARAARATGEILRSVLILFSTWLRVTIGILGEARSISDMASKVARRAVVLVGPILVAWALGAAISTDLSRAFSGAYSALFEVVERMWEGLLALLPAPSPGGDLLVLGVAVVAAASGRALLAEVARARESGGLRDYARAAGAGFAFWATTGYLLGLHKFSHVAAAYTIALAAGIGVASLKRLWRRRRRIALYGFVIFTLFTLMVHSAAAFERARAAEAMGSETVGQLVRSVVASYAGVNPSDVDVSVGVEPGGWIVRAVVTVSESRLRAGPVMTPKVVEAAQDALSDALGVDIVLRVEYRIVP